MDPNNPKDSKEEKGNKEDKVFNTIRGMGAGSVDVFNARSQRTTCSNHPKEEEKSPYTQNSTGGDTFMGNESPESEDKDVPEGESKK
ncbi:hypothetical protein Daesc_007919 [Daldinia eschscholtzii]|uniref:Uncharacterized protein n=1 Tax=Daldinia eschscholtzii TaxID=292717 RepID=A0AAX6MFV9_9PEZI